MEPNKTASVLVALGADVCARCGNDFVSVGVTGIVMRHKLFDKATGDSYCYACGNAILAEAPVIDRLWRLAWD